MSTAVLGGNEDMKLNKTMLLTKQQQRGFVPFTVFLGILIVPILQYLTQLVTEKIPNAGWAEIYDNTSTLVVIIFIIIYCKLIEGRNPDSLGFIQKNVWKNYGIGLLIGLFFITTVFFLNLITGSINISVDFGSIKWWFIIFSFIGFMFQGLMEEVVCRGFIMNSISSRYSVTAGIIINSLIFAILHGLNPGFGPLAGFNLFLAGLLFSIIFYYTDSIYIVAAIHTVWNFTVGPIYGVQISGTPAYSAIINTVGKDSNSLINGGAFGFEGGLGLTIPTLLLISFFIYLIKNKTWEQIINNISFNNNH
ncbi:lysostaphin resistance A-like protein [Lactococcus petauri]